MPTRAWSVRTATGPSRVSPPARVAELVGEHRPQLRDVEHVEQRRADGEGPGAGHQAEHRAELPHVGVHGRHHHDPVGWPGAGGRRQPGDLGVELRFGRRRDLHLVRVRRLAHRRHHAPAQGDHDGEGGEDEVDLRPAWNSRTLIPA